jgi:hypothetical protein
MNAEINVETLHSTERKHVLGMFSFHQMQSFHLIWHLAIARVTASK